MKIYKKQIVVLFITAILAWYISTFWYQFILVLGQSMQPSYYNWQIAMLSKQPSELKIGDVIAFKSEALDSILIKRIVAVPGDILQIKDGTLYINGLSSMETSSNSYISFSGIAQDPIILTSDEYFVLGDNYECSKDSRYKEIGCIKRKDIMGKVLPQEHIK